MVSVPLGCGTGPKSAFRIVQTTHAAIKPRIGAISSTKMRHNTLQMQAAVRKHKAPETDDQNPSITGRVDGRNMILPKQNDEMQSLERSELKRPLASTPEAHIPQDVS